MALVNAGQADFKPSLAKLRRNSFPPPNHGGSHLTAKDSRFEFGDKVEISNEARRMVLSPTDKSIDTKTLAGKYDQKTVDLLLSLGMSPSEIDVLLRPFDGERQGPIYYYFHQAIKSLQEAGITDGREIQKLLAKISSRTGEWTASVYIRLDKVIGICRQQGLNITSLTPEQEDIVFGINPARFSDKGYREIVSNRLTVLTNPQYQDDRPLALIIYPESDHNGYFDTTGEIIDDLISRGFRVMYYEISTEKEFIASFKQAAFQQKVSLAVIGGHGAQTTTELGNAHGVNREFTEIFSLDTSDEKQFTELRNLLTEDAQVISLSCSTGSGREAKNNMANMWARVFPGRPIFAPEVPAGITTIKWQGTNGTEVAEVKWFVPSGGYVAQYSPSPETADNISSNKISI